MKTNVKFTCKLVIGIGGYAVLDLVEWCHPDWCAEPGAVLECVKDDITSDGAESWVDYGISGGCKEMPHKDGIYKVTGEALFTEDESHYQNVTFERV